MVENIKQEKRIINSCNTCRLPIYEGEPIYSSQDSTGSQYRQGAVAGASHTPSGHARGSTTYHGGTYGEYSKQWHNSEIWTQCSWCYDQWQNDIKRKDKWEKELGKYTLLTFLPSLALAILLAYCFPTVDSKESGQWAQTALVYGFGALLVSYGLAHLIMYSKWGSKPTVDRYKMRYRSTIK